jgi:catalase-peroxidase
VRFFCAASDLIVLGGNAELKKLLQMLVNLWLFLFSRTYGCIARTNRCGIIAVLEPQTDGFRNYVKTKYTVSAEEMLVDKAQY